MDSLLLGSIELLEGDSMLISVSSEHKGLPHHDDLAICLSQITTNLQFASLVTQLRHITVASETG